MVYLQSKSFVSLSPLQAEMQDIKEAVVFASKFHNCQVIIESDCLTDVNLCQAPNAEKPWKVDVLTDQIR